MIRIVRTSSFSCQTGSIISREIRSPEGTGTIFVAPESSKAVIERYVMRSVIEERHPEEVKIPSESGDTVLISGAVSDGDVLSFIRLGTRILEMTGSDAGNGTDRNLLRNAIYRVMAGHLPEFSTFRKFAGRFEYIDKLIDLLGDFTRFGIGEEEIARACGEAEGSDDEVYKGKISDLKILMYYLKKMEEEFGLTLLEDPITAASKVLLKLTEQPELQLKRRYRPLMRFLDRRFLVLGFGTSRLLTPREIDLVRCMSALGSEIVFNIISDGNEPPEGQSIYYFGNRFIEQICEAVPGTSVEVLEGEDPYKPLACAADNAMGSERPEDQIEKTPDVFSITLGEVDDRIAYIANEVIRLTRQEGYRYKDIRIVCVDEAMIPRLYGTMKLFGLESFVDRKIILDNTPVFRYVMALSELPLRHFALEDVLRFMRNGLSGVLPSDADLFENYCVKSNISGEKRIFDREFFTSGKKYIMTTLDDGRQVPAAEYLWERVVERVLMPAHDTAFSVYNRKTISDKAMALAEHVDSKNRHIRALAKELTEDGRDETASALVRGYKEVMTLLTGLTAIYNDVPVTHDVFCSLIRIDMRNKSQGTIPLKVDSVEITTVDQAFITPCRALFVIGATESNFPFGRVSDGVMSRLELEKLSEGSGVTIPDKAILQNRQEFVTSALMFCASTDRIFFVSSDREELSRTVAFFEKYSAHPVDMIFKTPVYGKPGQGRHDYEKAYIDPEVMSGIIGDELRVSVSSLEKYNKCPMEYMLEEILKIKQRDDGRKVGANNMGTILHDMYQFGFEETIKEHGTPEKLISFADELESDPDKLHQLAMDLFNGYCGRSENTFEKTEDFFALAGRKAMRIFEYTYPSIVREAGSKGYVPSDFEMDLKKLDPPMTIEALGKHFLFSGYIDRVDKNYIDGKYRVIDYKSGDKKVDFKDALAGIQIQLFAYADAVMKREGEGSVTDAGYFEIGLKPDKDGIKLEPRMASLKDQEFDDVVSYVRYIINEDCNKIASGESPALINSEAGDSQRTGCEYCPFKGGCGNNSSDPKKNYVSDVMDPETGYIEKPKTEDLIAEMNRRREGRR